MWIFSFRPLVKRSNNETSFTEMRNVKEFGKWHVKEMQRQKNRMLQDLFIADFY